MDRVFDYIYSDELLKFIKVRPILCTPCIAPRSIRQAACNMQPGPLLTKESVVQPRVAWQRSARLCA